VRFVYFNNAETAEVLLHGWLHDFGMCLKLFKNRLEVREHPK